MLREHQAAGIDLCVDSIRSGKHRPVLAAPCSYGKTYVAAEIAERAQKKNKKVLFVCDRIKLVEQTVSHFNKVDFGVQQGDHPLYNPAAPIQIASVQTLSSRKRMPEFDLAIIDECHFMYEYVIKMIQAYNKIPFIGLSATPYSKGLGAHYNNLLVPITPMELIEKGHLCEIEYHIGRHADTSNVKKKRLKTGGTEYNEKSLAEAVESDKKLTGDITRNWFEKAYGKMTISFCPSIKASKWFVDEFIKLGVEAVHIDGFTDKDERKEMFEAHRAGEITILSCSQLLNTGYDEPGLECLIDCYSVRSLISYCQRGGRIQRTAPGKEKAIYLDHAGNYTYHGGGVESFVPFCLDDGKKNFKETAQAEKVKENQDVVHRECPQCFQQMKGVGCACGYKMPSNEVMEHDGSTLVKVKTAAEKRNISDSASEKAVFYSELLAYAAEKSKKDWWVDCKYKERYAVRPTHEIERKKITEIRDSTKKWIKSRNIAYSKSRKANL